MDGAISLALQSVRFDGLTQLAGVFYALGNDALLWVILAVVFLPFAEKRACGVLMIISIVIAGVLVSLILSNIIGRARPSDAVVGLAAAHGISRAGYAFPCGIAATSFAASVCMGRTLGSAWGMPFFIVALLISVSPLYLGVNYTSDVIAGAVIGFAIGWIVTFIYHRSFGELRRPNKSRQL